MKVVLYLITAVITTTMTVRASEYVDSKEITNLVSDTLGSLSGPATVYAKEGINYVACFACTTLVDLVVYLLQTSELFYEIVGYVCTQVSWGLLCDFALPSAYLSTYFISSDFACSFADICPLFDVKKRSYDFNMPYEEHSYNNNTFDDSEPNFFENLGKSSHKNKVDVKYQKQIENFIARIPMEDVKNLDKIFNSFPKNNRDELTQLITEFHQNVRKLPIQDNLKNLKRIIQLFKNSLTSFKHTEAEF